MKKSRLDLIVVERGLFESRQIAQTAIMDGAILVNGVKVTKPGMNFGADAKIEVIKSYEVSRYVSRGGLKLEKAIQTFEIDVDQRVCLDLGASTGGFTDCLLQHNASIVYAIDVGYGQIDWKLRQDQRVILMERVNARYLKPEELYNNVDRPRATLFVVDVSFISLGKILPSATQLVTPEISEGVCLIKPQFEVGKNLVEKGGVVRSADAHVLAISGVIAASADVGLTVRNLTFSPITGPAGNIEYLIHFANYGGSTDIDVAVVVHDAIRTLRSKAPTDESSPA